MDSLLVRYAVICIVTFVLGIFVAVETIQFARVDMTDNDCSNLVKIYFVLIAGVLFLCSVANGVSWYVEYNRQHSAPAPQYIQYEVII